MLPVVDELAEEDGVDELEGGVLGVIEGDAPRESVGEGLAVGLLVPLGVDEEEGLGGA